MTDTVAWVALAVSIVGGLPGATGLVQQFRKRTRLALAIHNVTTGSFTPPGTPPGTSLVLLALSLGNQGERPVVLADVWMELRYNDHWVRLSNTLIPPDAAAALKEGGIVFPTNPSDLQKWTGALTQSAPFFGYLAASTSVIPLAVLQGEADIRGRLVCTDVLGKKFRLPFTLKGIDDGQPWTYPKHGMAIPERRV